MTQLNPSTEELRTASTKALDAYDAAHTALMMHLYRTTDEKTLALLRELNRTATAATWTSYEYGVACGARTRQANQP